MTLVAGRRLVLTISDPWDLVTDLGDPSVPLTVVATATLPDGRDSVLARAVDDRLDPEVRALAHRSPREVDLGAFSVAVRRPESG